MRTPEHGRRAERLRHRAVRLARAGNSAARIARLLRVDPRTVRRWKTAYRRLGRPGLRTRRPTGRPCRLSTAQRRQLVQLLVRGASRQGFPTDLWTCPRIAAVIAGRFGVRYHVDHVPRLMRRLGFSPQRPERRARERDEDAIRAWIERDWRRIKKRRPAAAAPSFSSTKPAST
jgi:transposase